MSQRKNTTGKTTLCAGIALAAALVLGAAPIPGLLPSAAFAVDNMTSKDAPDLTSVRAKIEAKNYTAAIEELRGLADTNQHADVYNLLGFSLRKSGDFKTALTYYTKALEFQPDHKAAREYLGELYVETGNLEKAREQLAALVKLCPGGCEERADLEKALAAKSASN
jgi:Flp pilus assembly protein TadD